MTLATPKYAVGDPVLVTTPTSFLVGKDGVITAVQSYEQETLYAVLFPAINSRPTNLWESEIVKLEKRFSDKQVNWLMSGVLSVGLAIGILMGMWFAYMVLR